jgi:hypothetical protein
MIEILRNSIFMHVLHPRELTPTTRGYNPIRDWGVWLVLLISGLGIYAQGGDKVGIIQMAVFLIIWEGWIIYRKGEKWSFMTGFLISIAAMYITGVVLLDLLDLP